MRAGEDRYSLGVGLVSETYPLAWEVDILAEDGGVVPRAVVLGPRFPERSAESRPQWVIFGYVGALNGRAVCWPIESRLTPPDVERSGYVYWDEFLNFRLSCTVDNVFEIRNRDGDMQYRFRIEQDGGIIRLDTPDTRIVQTQADKSILIECAEELTVHCKNATVNVDEDATVTVGGDVTATVGGDIVATVAGNVTATVTGNVTLSAAAVGVTAATTTFTGNVVITGILTLA